MLLALLSQACESGPIIADCVFRRRSFKKTGAEAEAEYRAAALEHSTLLY